MANDVWGWVDGFAHVLQREMAETKHENEEEIRSFRKENEDMKRQLTEGTLSKQQQQPDVSLGSQHRDKPLVQLIDHSTTTHP